MPSVAAKSEVSEAPLNRELSRLDYNAGVLDQAANPGLPLLERGTALSAPGRRYLTRDG